MGTFILMKEGGERANTPDVPASEALERAWASNDKVQFDNTIHQANQTNTNAQTFREQMQHEYLLDKQQEREHKERIFTQSQENNRYTLNALYTLPEDMMVLPVNLIPILEELLKILKENQ